MTMRTLEMAIVREAREVTNTPKLRLKDLQEWANVEEHVRSRTRDGETFVALPQLGLWAAFTNVNPEYKSPEPPKPAKKKKAKKK